MGKTWETACGLSTSHVFFNAHPETWGRWTCFVMLRNMFQIGDDPPTSIGHKDSTRPSNQQPKGQAALREDKRMAWQVMRCQRGSITSHPKPTPSNAASSHAEVQHDHTLHHSGWYSPQRWQVETVEITSWSLGGLCWMLGESLRHQNTGSPYVLKRKWCELSSFPKWNLGHVIRIRLIHRFRCSWNSLSIFIKGLIHKQSIDMFFSNKWIHRSTQEDPTAKVIQGWTTPTMNLTQWHATMACEGSLVTSCLSPKWREVKVFGWLNLLASQPTPPPLMPAPNVNHWFALIRPYGYV